MKNNKIEPEKKHSVDLIYPIAIDSYVLSQKRLEVVEKRLQELLGFVVTITFAIITLLANKNFNFRSCLFYLAIIFFIIGLGTGLYARLNGYLILIKPADLHEKYRLLTETKFKNYFIYFAGKHWNINTKLINSKGQLTTYAMTFFIIEIILLILWVAVSAYP